MLVDFNQWGPLCRFTESRLLIFLRVFLLQRLNGANITYIRKTANRATAELFHFGPHYLSLLSYSQHKNRLLLRNNYFFSDPFKLYQEYCFFFR